MAQYRANVTRASTSGVWVTIPRYVAGAEFGPLEVVANTVRVGPLTTETASSHTHDVLETEWLADLVEVGDTVLVTNLGSDTLPDFVVIGVLRTGVSA